MLRNAFLYESGISQFHEDILLNNITKIMRENYKNYFGMEVQDSEFNSWQNSLQYIKNLLELAGLKDNKIVLEYQVPYNSGRIDCLLFGKGNDEKSYVIIIELKQWNKVKALKNENNFEEAQVETFTGHKNRIVPHPSQQVEGYHQYIINFIELFEFNKNFNLFSCAYCHNYSRSEDVGLFDRTYDQILNKYPLYAKEDVKKLAEKLKELLSQGDGLEIFNKFMQSPKRPSKKLLENISDILDNKPVFSLLNEQIVAKNLILGQMKSAEEQKKVVVIVHGGPGTGKTVIALSILAEIARKKNKSVFFSSKSKPLIEAIKHKVGKDNSLIFTNLNPFVPNKTTENQIDILIIDEAHRIGKTSNMQFTPAMDRTDMPQIEQLIRCAKTSVFFIDDLQKIRSLEVGSINLIKETAKKYGCIVKEVRLPSQFRCAGSDNYLDWLESVLGHSIERRILKIDEAFEFKIFNSPAELYEAIKQKNSLSGFTARIVAGYCWPWSKTTNPDGSLINDVKIETFEMPWETHNKVKPPRGYVKWYEWAYKPEGIKQVGCIYTAQGFEFDYIGVIIGNDLKYDKKNDKLIADRSKTCDSVLKRSKEHFEEYVKNIYRVLMSRGMKGCYVYFVDKEVEQYFRSRIE